MCENVIGVVLVSLLLTFVSTLNFEQVIADWVNEWSLRLRSVFLLDNLNVLNLRNVLFLLGILPVRKNIFAWRILKGI